MRIRFKIRGELDYDDKILFNSHHLSHAGSAFLDSPFDKAAILTVDGVGEWTTTMISEGINNEIHPLEEIEFPNSLGLLYSTVTSYLGFMVNNDEYKVMGLASYGELRYVEDFKEEVIDIREDGSFRLNMDYFSFRSSEKMWNEDFEELFGLPREYEGEIDPRHKDIACSLQEIMEEVMENLARRAWEITGYKNLCVSGGVALNSASNGNRRKNSPFDRIWIQPAATDAGDALGASLYVYNHVLGNNRSYEMKDVYLGPEYLNSDIKSTLDKEGANFQRMSPGDLRKKVVELLRDKNVVRWFQGRMEWGQSFGKQVYPS